MASIIEHGTTWHLTDEEVRVMGRAGLIYQCPADHGVLDATEDELPIFHVENASMTVCTIQEMINTCREEIIAFNKFRQADDQFFECMNCGVLRTHDPVRWIGCNDELGKSCRKVD